MQSSISVHPFTTHISPLHGPSCKPRAAVMGYIPALLITWGLQPGKRTCKASLKHRLARPGQIFSPLILGPDESAKTELGAKKHWLPKAGYAEQHGAELGHGTHKILAAQRVTQVKCAVNVVKGRALRTDSIEMAWPMKWLKPLVQLKMALVLSTALLF